jgi:hypothetical protein
MKRLRKGPAVAAVALVMGSLAAGCGQSGAVNNAISSLSPSRSVTLTPTRSAPATRPAPTSQPSQTAPPTGQAAEPAQAGSTAPASGSGSSLLWLWILLGAVIVIGAIVWIARASGRRSAAAAGWRSTLIDAYAKGQALADGLRLADAPGAAAAGDADARWAGLQARADELTQELYALCESAPGEEDRARVEDALASLQALRSAMAAAHAPGRAGEPQAARVRSRLPSFEAAIRALREPERLPRI